MHTNKEVKEYWKKNHLLNVRHSDLNKVNQSIFCHQCKSMHSVRRSVLRNFAKFTGKHLRQSLLFNKVAGLGSGTGVFLLILQNF